MPLIDLNEQISGPKGQPGRGKTRGPGRRAPSADREAIGQVQKFLLDRGLPVRRRDPQRIDYGWGQVTNRSLNQFIQNPKTEADKRYAEAISKMVSSDYKATAPRVKDIANILAQSPGKGETKLEKPKELYRINFRVDGKEIKNFPITYLLSKMDVSSKQAVKKSTIYMIEFLKAYGALPPGDTDWTTIQGPFTKVVAAMSEVLKKAGYPRLQSYMAPMEGFIVDMAEKARQQKPGAAGTGRSILELLDGVFPGGSEYHKVRQSPEATRRLLAYLAGDLRFSDQQGNLVVSEGRVRGSLAKILDYAKGLLGSLQRGRVTAPPAQTAPATPATTTPTPTPSGGGTRSPTGRPPMRTVGP